MSKPRMGASKRVAVGLLAGALSVFGVAFAPTAGAVTDVTTDRVAGTTRFGTASAACARAYPAGTATAIIATARNFPDALAASGLAGARNACIFLTEVDDVPEATLQGLTQNKITNSIIVGGTNAVSTAAENELRAAGQTVTRIAGANRYATAAAIANAITTVGTVGGAATCIVASGEVAADALAAGPVAARGDNTNPFPILLVRPNEVPSETAQALQAKCRNVILVGGTAAISEAVRTQIGTLTGDTSVDRVAGTDRFLTAVAIANYAITTLRTFPAPTTVLLANGLPASGEPFSVDALVAGPLGDVLGAPILLVQQGTLGTAVRDFLDANSPTIRTVLGVGGTAVIDQAVLDQADAAAQTTTNDVPTNRTVTTLPELVSAAIVTTVQQGQQTAAQPVGTYVRYTFDEAVLNATAALFHIYNTSGTLVDSGDAATVEAAGNSVLVRFDPLQTPASTTALTLATVDLGAASDNQGNLNPEGDAAIGTAATGTTGAAGTTTAPDLVSVTGFRAGATAGQTIVDFTFDQAAFVLTNAGGAAEGASAFTLVNSNNGEIACVAPTSGAVPSGGTTAGGQGTTVISVSCTNPVPAVGITAASIARGTVNTGAVSSAAAAGTTNVLHAADVSSTTTAPDLVSASFVQGTAANGGLDQVVYTFDQAVAAPFDVTAFCVYDAQAVQTCGGTTPTVNPANNTQVLVTFGATTVDNAVGASVRDAAVTAASLGGGTNQQDEVGVANTNTSTQTPGKTAAPELTAVTLSTGTDPFGNPGGYRATYTFDSPTTSAITVAAPGNFFLYLANGRRLTATTCTAGTVAAGTANTVTCTVYAGFAAGSSATEANAALGSAVLGTVDNGAVTSGGIANPEGGEPTTGGTGTAVNP